MHTIRNNFVEISVKTTGAELCSFKSLKTNIEYIWEADPSVWGSHAPNLFPIIGVLKEGGFVYNGKEYKCPKHGFIRHNKKISLVRQAKNSLTFGLRYSKDTLAIYPFKFQFEIKYTLQKNTVEIEHIITNLGDIDMLFSLGGHPAFKCPIHSNESYNDYYLEFEKEETAETWQIENTGLIGSKTKPVFNNPTKINLHDTLFNKDALVLKNLNSSKVSLKSKKSNQTLSVQFNEFPYLGIWAKPKANYVCIEPWLGIADSWNSSRDLEKKEGIIRLFSKKTYKATYSITMEE